ADGSEVLRNYHPSYNTNDHLALGWAVTSTVDKYADANEEITPYPNASVSGDVYRGYFVPSQDGIYKFANTVRPDNSVRFLMSLNECPKDVRALVSADWAGAKVGAAHADSIWIKDKNGTYQTM